jgi:ribosomal protein L16 Arg81 hydroxylase
MVLKSDPARHGAETRPSFKKIEKVKTRGNLINQRVNLMTQMMRQKIQL